VHRHFPTREELMDAVRRQARDDADSDEEDFVRPLVHHPP
jgi:AcrR family transcriptional regulator